MNKLIKIYLLVILVFSRLEYIFSCTGFYVVKGDKIFAGNNEDFPYPFTKMWTIPGTENSYGRIYFGYDNFTPQGGMNEKGLFFDGYATDRRLPINIDNDKPKYDKFFDDIRNEIMATCSNVKDVIKLINNYNLTNNDLFENAMLFWGDSEGNSIIIDGGNIVSKTGDFQVVTNFHVSKSDKITCYRYLTATKLLKNMEIPSVIGCKDALDSVHVSETIYSQVYDIKNLRIYVYNYHNYSDCYEVDLEDVLKKGFAYYDLSSMFQYSKSYEEFKKQNWYKYSKIFNTLFNKNLNNKIEKRYLGEYYYTSFQAPDLNMINFSDSLHTATIRQDEQEIFLEENYGCYGKFKIYPITNDKFFYLTRYYWAEIIFDHEGELNLIAQLYDESGKKWITKLKKQAITMQ